MADQTLNQGVPGLGCTISYALHASGSFTALGQVKNIGSLSFETAMQDSTGLLSAMAEQLPTLQKGGDVPVGVIWNGANTTHAAMFAAWKNKTLYYWQVAFPPPVGATTGGVSGTFPAYVNKFSTGESTPEGLHDGEVNLAISGACDIA